MECTLCGSRAVMHFVGHHPKAGYSTTGIARCGPHREYGFSQRELAGASLEVFFERIDLDERRRG